MVLTSALERSLITRHTEVLEMVAGSLARNSTQSWESTNLRRARGSARRRAAPPRARRRAGASSHFLTAA